SVERPSFGEERQPPVPARLAVCFVAADQVALADHADRSAHGIDDGHCADPMVMKNFRHLASRRVETDRHHRRGHYVTSLHPMAVLYPAVFRPSISCLVWRAICSSSCEVRTRTAQCDTGSLIGLAAERLRVSSRPTPIQDNPAQIAVRTCASFSPM